jgi:hypothetical protein
MGFWHPYRDALVLILVRGYRFAQPPANRLKAFGLAEFSVRFQEYSVARNYHIEILQRPLTFSGIS